MPAQLQIIEIKIITILFLFSFHITSICVHKCILKQSRCRALLSHTHILFHFANAKGFHEKSRNDANHTQALWGREKIERSFASQRAFKRKYVKTEEKKISPQINSAVARNFFTWLILPICILNAKSFSKSRRCRDGKKHMRMNVEKKTNVYEWCGKNCYRDKVNYSTSW